MRLDPNQFIAHLMKAQFAQNDVSPLLDVGFLQKDDGDLVCENLLIHDPIPCNTKTITEPAELTYKIVINGDLDFTMKHVIVPIGMAGTSSRLVCEDVVLPLTVGSSVHVAIKAYKNRKEFDRLFSGTFQVPERQHCLGYPGGPQGYMVQVFQKNMLFVQPSKRKVTFQGVLSEIGY